jgi:hydroxymethylbilane synthase
MTDVYATLRLGTRGSALAVRQAERVAAEIRRRAPALDVELVRIKTSGDRIRGRSLVELGGKGLFVKEIDEALGAGAIDLAVHSMKDLPASLAAGVGIAAVPVRADPKDVLIARRAKSITSLAAGARIGTGSLRRRAFLRHLRPDVEVVPLRGNVDTRIGKWRSGEVDAIVLAAAGLERLDIELDEASAISTQDMLPAIGQGALGVEAAIGGRWWAIAAALNDADTADAVAAERGFLRGMGGDCTTPIAAHATVAGEEVRLEAAVADPDGRRLVRGTRTGGRAGADELGRALAEELLARGGAEILRALRR